MNGLFRSISGLAAITIILTSCLKDDNPNEAANQQLYEVMDQYYLWFDQMPSVTPKNYSTPVDLLEALKYKQLDRWSYITTRQQLEAYYEEGSYVGFGFGSAFDQSGNLWITYTFANSPLRPLGIGRGWRIELIDGFQPTAQNVGNLFGPATVGLTRYFEFRGPNNELVSHTITKRNVTMNTVLMDSVYTIGANKVGYLVLKGFIVPTKAELNDVFARFGASGVNEIIVDLRYNGGGRMDVANHFAGLIAGNIANNQVLTKLINNSKNQGLNTSDTIKVKPNSLTFNRAVFITTSNSASASESLINGLKPYMAVSIVGSRTHGKPVGMYSFVSPSYEWAFVPICFSITNALNEGNYFDGIPVNIAANDDIARDFGDINESSLNAALGVFGAKPTVAKVSSNTPEYHTKRGLAQEIDAW